MTNRYGLIGFPLSHSFSRKYFTDKFLNQSIDAAYDLFPIESIYELHALLNSHPGLRGLNITIPYKQKIIPLLDIISEEAAIINAVNTVKITSDNGRFILEGFNTDAPAFESELTDFTGYLPDNALILGTGGASAAVAYVLTRLGWKFNFVSRKAEKSGILTYESLNEDIIRNSTLIINCTPSGMYPDIDNLPPIPYSAITKDHFLFDLVYNPEYTAFLRKGKDQGAAIRNGLGMLHKQAELSWEIWQK